MSEIPTPTEVEDVDRAGFAPELDALGPGQ